MKTYIKIGISKHGFVLKWKKSFHKLNIEKQIKLEQYLKKECSITKYEKNKK